MSPRGGGGGTRRGPGGPRRRPGEARRGSGPRPPSAKGKGGRPAREPGRPAAASPVRSRRAVGVGGEQVEGRNAVRELLLAGRRRVHEVLMATDLDPAPVLEEIRQLAAEARVPVREVARTKLEAAARTDAPQGVVARAAPLPELALEDLLAPTASPGVTGAPFLLALDGVTDPGNVGALLRTAACAGVSGVVLPRHRAAHVTPAVAKAAAGAVEHLPIALVGGLPAALATLAGSGVWVVGLDAGADRPLWDLGPADEPICLVLGAEGRGLGRLVRSRCDEVVAIPMRGRLESLNVAVAGALALYEVARRRVGPPAG